MFIIIIIIIINYYYEIHTDTDTMQKPLFMLRIRECPH